VRASDVVASPAWIPLPTYSSIYAREFEKRGRTLKVRVEGQLVFNNIALRVNGLVRVLGDWCPPFSGYHLYYPGRRQAAPAFALLVEALRYRGSSR
jgi:hypothetical protein